MSEAVGKNPKTLADRSAAEASGKGPAGEVEDMLQQEHAALQEAVSEYPTFTREVASISPESFAKLKEELGMGPGDMLVGLPAEAAAQYELSHGDEVLTSKDGKTVMFEGKTVRVVTATPKGPLTKCMLSKAIRQETGLKDHRETGTGKAEMVPFTLVIIGGKKILWLKAGQKE